jgi:glutamate dehydrogenase/leucine dehydrogenase
MMEKRLPAPPSGSTNDPWEMAFRQFHHAADHLSLKRGIRDFLSHPHHELTVNFPVKMDDGSVRAFIGYRVVHNSVMGPTKGGIATASRWTSTRSGRWRCG